MKTIVIPVDFSATSNNALRFAAALSCDRAVERIILLKSFYVSIYEQILPSIDFVQLSPEAILAEREKIENQLQALGKEVLQHCPRNVQVETVISELPLLRAIHQLADDETPDLLIAGSDDRETGEETDIGSQVIEIAKTSKVRVLIVPPDAVWQKPKFALIPCDFSAVSRLGALKDLPFFKDRKDLQLLILHVDPKHTHLHQEEAHEQQLKELLEGYVYQLYYSESRNTIRGILQFADDHEVQLIVALPGRHSFLYSLTHRSITDGLAKNARKPVLILK